ncbi:hypothetical protein SADUNF_Sadunf15G0104500 [Salix dunnii]|uniref:DCD domain-containing protein n=1 Tax=Salix dunnii TaxID=1413687 RepID=A0A835JJC9_9ROSI|nr:hypothetical protein SADUNF_Sadunf15G0104500 [Salix dunnii]
MKFYEPDNVPGKYPEFGAIFMSNRATRNECFRRKLLGLPSGQADFVKQVKAGMILFLFEFERRELHGVFQACSDGTVNIVPHAYSSSGKQFPAQVKFIQLWQCDALSENEFRDAIIENYFSPYKFNFGLSERQVEKLLLLFSKRKIKDGLLERQFSRYNVAKEARSVTGDGSFVTIDTEKDERNAGATFGSSISTENFGDSTSKHRREYERCTSPPFRNGHKTNRTLISKEQFVASLSEVGGLAEDARVVRSNMVENDQDVDIESRTNVLTEHHGCSITTSIRSSDYVNFARSYGLGQELMGDNGFQLPSTEHTGMFQSNPGLAEDARVVTHNMAGNGHDVDMESRMDVLTNHHGHSFPARRRSSDYVNSASRYGLGQELMEDNGFQQPSTKYTDRFQSNLPQCFSKPILEENSSVSDHFQQSSAILVEQQNSQYYRQPILEAIKDKFRPSTTARHLMEPHNSELSFSALDGDRLPRSNDLYPTSYGDGVGASDIPYDPDVSRLGNRCSSSRGLSNSAPEFPASHSIAIPSFDQSFHPHVEPEGTNSHLNINASLSDYILLSNANQHDHLNRPGMLFPGADYPGHAARNSSMNGNTGHKRSLSSFELCNSVPQCPPHNIFPAFVNESFPSYIEAKSTSECQNLNSFLSCDSPFSHPGHHDHANRTSMLYRGAAYPENVQRNSSGIEGTREDTSACSCSLNRSSSFVSAGRYSVSSQEELDHQMSQLENDENDEAFSISVPRLKHHENGLINLVTRENSERMFSDHQKRKSVFSRLALPSEACKQDEHDVDSSVDEVMTILHQSHIQRVKEKKIKPQMKRHDEVTNFKDKKQNKNSQLLMVQLPEVSKGIIMNDISAGKGDDLQIPEVIPFIDFKRRRKAQKIVSDANTGSTENTGLSGQQHKRRKLIRPKFSGNGSSGNVNIGSQGNASRMTRNVELPDMTFHIDLEDNNTGFQGCSDCEGNEKVANFVATSSNANGDSKEALQDVGPVSSEYNSNKENSLPSMNSEADGIVKCGLDHDGGNGNISDNVKSENRSFHDGGNEKLPKNAEVANRSCPTTGESALEIIVSSRMDYNCGSEKGFKEVGNGEESKQQLFLPSVGEQCKASIETVSYSNTKESPELCEQDDKRVEVKAAAAGKDCKVVVERENSGNGNRESPRL